MPDTTDRPTPELATPDELAEWWGSASASNFLAILRGNGYVIVHPDDVPRRPVHSDDFEFSADFFDAGDNGDRLRNEGWNACRAHIFGTDA